MLDHSSRFPQEGVLMTVMFHDGNRQLQDQFDSRRIADRLEEKLIRFAFNEGDRAFIQGAMFFFLATADADGCPPGGGHRTGGGSAVGCRWSMRGSDDVVR